jgi:hypothetical protein
MHFGNSVELPAEDERRNIQYAGFCPFVLSGWWEMEEFRATAFYAIGRYLQRVKSVAANFGEDKQALLTERHREQLTGMFGRIERSCATISLRLSMKSLRRAIKKINDGNTTHRELIDLAQEIDRRIQDEIDDDLFLYVPQDRASFYNQRELFGTNVNAKFPSIQFDLVEAGNCYAVGRSTGTVFHLMRIMETGVQEFGKKLGVNLATEKNWQNILDEVNKKIKTLPAKDPETIELSQVSANLYAVKLAWRNEVMHPKDTYTLEEADNLIRQVRIFMQNLAKVV